MTVRRRLALLVAAAMAGPGGAQADAAGASQTLFDCRGADWSVQLLGSDDGQLILTMNQPSRRGSVGMATSHWDEVRAGHVVGQAGGHQSHVRLSDGIRQIILLEGMDGSLADRPGRTYAGALTITKSNPAQDFRIDCAADNTNANLVANLHQWAKRVGAAQPRAEAEDGPFDGWF